jgi:hypothetical protein
MNRIKWTVVVSSGLLLLGEISAGAAYQIVAGGIADGGSVTGQVVFDGTPPTPAMLTVDEGLGLFRGIRLRPGPMPIRAACTAGQAADVWSRKEQRQHRAQFSLDQQGHL